MDEKIDESWYRAKRNLLIGVIVSIIIWISFSCAGRYTGQGPKDPKFKGYGDTRYKQKPPKDKKNKKIEKPFSNHKHKHEK